MTETTEQLRQIKLTITASTSTSTGIRISSKTILTNKTEKEIQSITECLRDTWYLNFESVIKTNSKLKMNILEKLLA